MSDTLLTGEPGAQYIVENQRPEMDVEQEHAEADDRGVLRDKDGKSFSAGCYAIIEKA